MDQSYDDIDNTFTAPYEKYKIVSLTFLSRARFPVELIYCIAFGSASSACYLLKSIAITL